MKKIGCFLFIIFGLVSHIQAADYFEKIQKAVALYEQGDYENALIKLMAVKPLTSQDQESQSIWVAKIHYHLQNYNLALNELNEVSGRDVRVLKALNLFELDSFFSVIHVLKQLELTDSNTDTVIFLLAESQFEIQDYEAAISNYRILNFFEPEEQSFHRKLGICEYYEGNYMRSLLSLQTAVNFDPKDIEVYNYLGMSYFNINNIGKAIEVLKSGIDTNEIKSADAAVNLALVYDDIVEYDSSVWALNLALQIDSSKIDAYYFLGNIYFNRKEYLLSTFYYQKILEINPKYEYAYEQLANSYYHSGLYDEAIEKYRQSTFFNELDPSSYNIMGICYLQNNDWKTAFRYFEEAVKIAPNFGIAYYNLAGLAFNQGWYDEAISYCAYAFQYLQNDPDVFFLLGKIYIQLGMLNAAQTSFDNTIRFNSLNTNAYLYLGDLALMKNEKRKAEFYFNMHNTLDPESYDGNYYLGVTQFNLQEFEAAKISLEKAYTLTDSKEKSMFALSKTYLKLEEPVSAIKTLNQLIGSGYESGKVYLLLSLAYKDIKQKKQAKYYEELAFTVEPKLKKYVF